MFAGSRSTTLALRTQQILAHETGVARVADPLGGSYFVEALTDATEARIIDIMDDLERHGGMVSAILKGGLQASRRFLERCKLFTLAESLGGVESLIEHPAIMTHATIPAETRKKLGIGDALVRLSVGVEDLEDLRADLRQALNRI